MGDLEMIRRLRAFAAGLAAGLILAAAAPAAAQVAQWNYQVNPATGNGQAAYPGEVKIGNLAGAGGCVQADSVGLLSLSGGACSGGGISLSGNNTWTGTQTFTGATTKPAAVLTNAVEPVNVSATAATGTIALYAASQSVTYYTTNASANWTVNLSFSAGTTLNTALATGQAVTIVFMAAQGATPFYNNVVQVDGTTTGVTMHWQGAAPTAGDASATDVYTYTVVKTGSATFAVFASLTKFS